MVEIYLIPEKNTHLLQQFKTCNNLIIYFTFTKYVELIIPWYFSLFSYTEIHIIKFKSIQIQVKLNQANNAYFYYLGIGNLLAYNHLFLLNSVLILTLCFKGRTEYIFQ